MHQCKKTEEFEEHFNDESKQKEQKNLTLFPLGAAPLRDCCFAAAAAAPVPAGCAQSGGTAGHLDGRHLVRTTAPLK